MSAATATIPETTHLAIKVRVHPGKEAEFDDALTRFVQQTTDYRGVTGVHLQRPLEGDGSREFGIVRSFSSPTHCREFYATDYYKEYEAATASLRDGDIDFRPVQGIEALFRPAAVAPPRWKMATVTWLGVFPASLLWSRLVGARLVMLHPVLVTAVVTMLVVATVVWCAMPTLTKLLRPWLRKA